MTFLKSLSIAAASAVAMAGAAHANLITIAGGLGTVNCTASCEAFTLGAPGLGAEPNAAGTLSSTDAWYYDGQPSSENAEADRLSILLTGATGAFEGSDGSRTVGTGGDMTFDTLAEFVVLKLGDVAVFIRNTSGGMLNVVVDSFAGAGSGVSHYTEFGEVSDIPLPAAAWLMIAGVAGLGFAGRRKSA